MTTILILAIFVGTGYVAVESSKPAPLKDLKPEHIPLDSLIDEEGNLIE